MTVFDAPMESRALTAKLDRAEEDYSALATPLITFAGEEEAVRNLQSGLTKTLPGCARSRKS